MTKKRKASSSKVVRINTPLATKHFEELDKQRSSHQVELGSHALNTAAWKLLDSLPSINQNPMSCKPQLREVIQTYLDEINKEGALELRN